MLKAEKIMRPYWPALRSAVLIAATGLVLAGCDSPLEPLVGKSREAADRAKPQAPPPAPPPTADQQFEALAQRYLKESPEQSPANATGLGDHRFDNQLNNMSAAS